MDLNLTKIYNKDACQVGWLVSGALTFVIWHHSLIHSRDLAPLIISTSTSIKCKGESILWNCYGRPANSHPLRV